MFMSDSKKINKKEYLAYVANKYQVNEHELSKSYDMLLDGLLDIVQEGHKVVLTGIGCVYLQKHKGHPVQFETVGASVKDYVVFKFAPSNLINQKMRQAYENGQAFAYEKPKSIRRKK